MKVKEALLLGKEIHEIFDKELWIQLWSELESKDKLNPDHLDWISDSDQGHYCRFIHIYDECGNLVNKKTGEKFYAWFDWRCNKACKQACDNPFEYEFPPYHLYLPSVEKCRFEAFWTSISKRD